ncbi:MAG TPA: hypothetical protein VM802_01385 [Chitinophaga sp.]|uniref:hypothetical protein n=1 Tax=Chitinophaga sp. TaxID=1869181 RepID=UPI002D1CB10C|nr:hypothetical protein [Chitinophaga sp.]HVI43484.1 hypothetical protein [Chitinophaga sp.]
MNQLRLSCTLVYATVVVFLTSCGGGNKTNTTNDTAVTNSTTPNTTPATNTVITTPQNMMICIHKVADFAKWKSGYDTGDSMRLASQIHSHVIGRGVKDPNMVLVATRVDDIAKAKAFAKAPNLKMAMQQSGVTGTPTFSFVTITFQDTAVIATDLRSSTTFMVKDWNTWQKAFEEGKQARLDNGLTVRAYGHDVDDNHKVTLVVAITDSVKADAYWKSDALKEKRKAAGVIGEPERFVFRIAQRY